MISQPAGIVVRWILLALSVSALSACATSQPVATRTSPHGDVGKRAAAVAMGQLGVSYRYGGSGPGGFDCSGLIQYSYKHAGKAVPRTTAALWNHTETVDGRQIRAGDLLFFNIAGKMSHVGLYLGNGRFVHAPSTGRVVSVESLNSEFYSRAFIRAGRPR